MERDLTDKYNILVYNDEYMIYYDGVLASFDEENIWDNGYFVTGEHHQSSLATNIRFTVSNLEQHETIKLDDTLMKRIAKFNEEIEIKKLDETIKKIKQIVDIYNNTKGEFATLPNGEEICLSDNEPIIAYLQELFKEEN